MYMYMWLAMHVHVHAKIYVCTLEKKFCAIVIVAYPCSKGISSYTNGFVPFVYCNKSVCAMCNLSRFLEYTIEPYRLSLYMHTLTHTQTTLSSCVLVPVTTQYVSGTRIPASRSPSCVPLGISSLSWSGLVMKWPSFSPARTRC